MRARQYLRLFRISAAITPAADATLGFGCALVWGEVPVVRFERLGAAALASCLIFCFAVALNDVLDAAKDAVQAPERPIPSGGLPRRRALGAAFIAAAASLAAAAALGRDAFAAAAAVLALTVLYNTLSRRIRWLGIVNLGLIRAADVLFGVVCAAGLDALDGLGRDGRFLLPGAYGFYALSLSGVALGERSPAPRPIQTVLFSVPALACAACLAAAGWRSAPEAAWLIGVCFIALALPALLRLRRAPGDAEPLVGHFVSGYLLAAAMPAAGFIGPAAGVALGLLYIASRILGRFFPAS